MCFTVTLSLHELTCENIRVSIIWRTGNQEDQWSIRTIVSNAKDASMTDQEPDAQIKFRVTVSARKKLQIAAAMRGQSMGEFIKIACVEAAENVIESFDADELDRTKPGS